MALHALEYLPQVPPREIVNVFRRTVLPAIAARYGLLELQLQKLRSPIPRLEARPRGFQPQSLCQDPRPAVKGMFSTPLVPEAGDRPGCPARVVPGYSHRIRSGANRRFSQATPSRRSHELCSARVRGMVDHGNLIAPGAITGQEQARSCP